ncbi:MAG: Rne/Rng family ribonuclease [Ignavibacteriales bacterium]|nr:Rne/Rng family ribonuclease [Ignavibacteriales bacterium]MCB9210174.1 Rne/Rng family ribonuclease [Ignavibacteriales bacterium]MCB9218441.1 Rne/Rng family ribonuclease [Ignavibacteriales bacterium]MCB9259553.1 Rne/Rng family ribonuclease [Ignavibacteriales bacterium]
MQKEIIINSSATQNRVAITEEGTLVDFFVDNPEKRRMVGNIYLGKVARVLPGIRAAFIDIGLKHDAFLHFSDIGDSFQEFQSVLDEEETDISVDDEENLVNTKEETEKKVTSIPKLHKGQDIIVQIIKEPVANKGVRISSAISIPGRFCVLLPFDNKIGISKKIADFKERKRLKTLAKGIIPENCGLIIRTAAKEQDEFSLESDLKYLVRTWNKIQTKVKSTDPPMLLYKDLSTTTSVIRDLFTSNVSKVFIDSKSLYKEIRDYIQLVQPELSEKIEYYKSRMPIYETFKIEEQIKTLMGRKVPIPNGGHIVIDHTEAMTVIDVNSGRYAAKKEQELNSLKTDLEASREIVRQLRLRDIGGLIVIDFIDLEEDKNRKKIYDELRKEFKKDRAKIAILPMTDFGIVQITRQRVRQNIVQSINEVCPYCAGTGLMTKRSTVIHDIDEWFKRYKSEGKYRSLVLSVHPSLSNDLKIGLLSTLRKLQFKYLLKIKLEDNDNINPQEFEVKVAKTGEKLN